MTKRWICSYFIMMVLLGFTESSVYSDTKKTAVKEWSKESGDAFAYDGVYYHFASPRGQGIRLWLPNTGKPVRGIILFGNPGGGLGGDTRNKSMQRDYQLFASRHNLGVAGVTGFPGMRIRNELGEIILNTFDEWAELGVHPELSTVPFIFTGSSNAGVFSFAMMTVCPERTICITPNVGPVYGEELGEEIRSVPAWLHVGTNDPFFPHGYRDTEALFSEHRPKGAFWAWEAEMKGHENGASDHVDMAYWESVMKLRLPDLVKPGEPVTLKPLVLEEGWVADTRTWDHDIVKILPASEAEPAALRSGQTSWLPDESIARLYQSAASRTRQIRFAFNEDRSIEGGQSTGVFLSASGNQLARVGDTVELTLALAPLQWGVKTVSIYDRNRKLGEVNYETSNVFSFTVEDQPLYALYARAEMEGRNGRSGYTLISNPLQLVVENKEISSALEKQDASVNWLDHVQDRLQAPDNLKLEGKELTPDDSNVLGVVALNEEQQKLLLGKEPEEVMKIWEASELSAMGIDQKVEAGKGISDQKLMVRAAYGDQGIFFHFSADHKGVGAGNVDFHLASIGPDALEEEKPSLKIFATPMLNHLLRRALQISVDLNGSDKPVSINYWQYWDMGNVKLSENDLSEKTGMQILRFPDEEGKSSLQLFLPWAFAGNPGLSSRPAPGQSMVTVMGYNGAEQSAKFRWPYGRDPWAVSATRSDQPVFGSLLFMAP